MIEGKLRIAYISGNTEEGRREAAFLTQVLGKGYEINSGRYEGDFDKDGDSIDDYDLLLAHPRNLGMDDTQLGKFDKRDLEFGIHVVETILKRHPRLNVALVSHVNPKTHVYKDRINGREVGVYFLSHVRYHALIRFIRGIK